MQGMQVEAPKSEKEPPPLSRQQKKLIFLLCHKTLDQLLTEAASTESEGWLAKWQAADFSWKALSDEGKLDLVQFMLRPGTGEPEHA